MASIASAEVYHIMGAMFRPDWLEMELFKTTESDVKRKHDFFAVQPDLKSKGVRVLFK